MTKEIPLKTWAERNFDPPPSSITLRRWARDCWIFPIPRKIGRDWRVREDARFIGSDHTAIGNGPKAA